MAIEIIKRFLAYLRGIETSLIGGVSLSLAMFLAYLRGIETQLVQVVLALMLMFLAYLRGIETGKFSAAHSSIEGF
ncbi:hypothetical protein TTE2652 [Caldanaerobacter subterraneus subsp. tengcongensis MB4]|uniref:Uncharacterized protein n=1 Tax=Caldanaerobacter subterraneus subsp. tengcongensis (strain DSM 15242 / JCM 11007 / NBRC 100824 / MB4) TaxID=273068 RepID=Q8R6Y1_CALS4|nr:hypothetical protein TTE2652 [Caldanaerobacter subterraneus subsp. tengcongensis MB4]